MKILPLRRASWENSGASRIHVVDLDGSVEGTPINLKQIEQIVNAVRVPVQLGGGIRNIETIRMYLDVGISTVILGTVAAREPDTRSGVPQAVSRSHSHRY